MLDQALEFNEMDRGWEAGGFTYGGGLMFMHSNRYEGPPYTMNMTTTYLGHEGITYGFHSRTGFYPNANFSMSVIVNNDMDMNFPGDVQCHMAQIILDHKGFPEEEKDLGCPEIEEAQFECI